MTAEGFDELLSELANDDGPAGDIDWGETRELEVGTTLAGWWRGEDEWQGNYGPTPIYLMTDVAGVEFFFFGGRKQLDKKIAKAALNVGDKVAIRRLEDGPPAEGQSAPWRVRVAVRRGDGTIPVAATDDDGDGDITF